MSPAITERTARHLRTTSTSAAAWRARSSSSGPVIRSRGPRHRTSPWAIRTSSPCSCASAASRWGPVPASARSHSADSGSSRAAAARVCPHHGVGRDHGHDATQMPGPTPHRQVPAMSRPVLRGHHRVGPPVDGHARANCSTRGRRRAGTRRDDRRRQQQRLAVLPYPAFQVVPGCWLASRSDRRCASFPRARATVPQRPVVLSQRVAHPDVRLPVAAARGRARGQCARWQARRGNQ